MLPNDNSKGDWEMDCINDSTMKGVNRIMEKQTEARL